jgi:3-hydroxy-D-aspartate aldolase
MNPILAANIGTRIEDIDTPCLLVDLDAYERNLERMAQFMEDHGLRHRAHAKNHKCAVIAHDQMAAGAVGVCCQKVSEAEALVNAGVPDVLVSNEVINPHMIDHLAAMAAQARVMVCVDDLGNIDDISAAAQRYNAEIGVMVEIDCGAGRCGVAPGEDAVPLAKKADAAANLYFAGLQAYQGKAQHVHDYDERKAQIDKAVEQVRDTVNLIEAAGLQCKYVDGAGTGTFHFEGTSGVYNELQCGSYIFMDADYQRVQKQDGGIIDEFENSLFIYTTVMSKTKIEKAICDAGLKAQSVDSGVAVVYGRDDIEYIGASDEHGVISDPDNHLKLGEKLHLVPGHCDPTVNIYDNLIGVRNGVVERIMPVTARGMCL